MQTMTTQKLVVTEEISVMGKKDMGFWTLALIQSAEMSFGKQVTHKVLNGATQIKLMAEGNQVSESPQIKLAIQHKWVSLKSKL